MPATSASAAMPARHSPRRDKRRWDTTPPFIRYAISTDCAVFTGNLAAAVRALCASQFYGSPSSVTVENFGRANAGRVARKGPRHNPEEVGALLGFVRGGRREKS